MAQSMTPSMITDGQIDKAADVLRAQVRKHRDVLPSDAVQQVLGNEQLGHKLFEVFRSFVEAVAGMIVRHAKVNRSREPQQALEATGLRLYTDGKVVKAMPKGSGEETDVYFFKVGRWISDADLDNEYEQRGHVPADPYTLAAVNEDDPAFADQYPNGTHWKDADDRWCFAAFCRWSGERGVNVGRRGSDWSGSWWFAGVRK